MWFSHISGSWRVGFVFSKKCEVFLLEGGLPSLMVWLEYDPFLLAMAYFKGRFFFVSERVITAIKANCMSWRDKKLVQFEEFLGILFGGNLFFHGWKCIKLICTTCFLLLLKNS